MAGDSDSRPPEEEEEDILEITWEDLQDEDLDLSGEVFPAVEPADAAVAGSRQPWIEVEALCAGERQPFGVRFQQTTPQVYAFAAVVERAPGAKPAPPAAGGFDQANAHFDLAGYTGCPHCGMPGLVQCDRCGTIMCGSAVHEDKKGMYCVCPNCGGRGQVASGQVVTVRGQVGGTKGKPGKKGF